MGSVRVVRGGAAPAGPRSQGMSRTLTRFDEVSFGKAHSGPQATSGWHHHGQRTTYVYVLQGQVHIEWGPGGRESVDLTSGDFYVVPPNTIHREGNPGSEENCLVGFMVGSGTEVVNVEEPEAIAA